MTSERIYNPYALQMPRELELERRQRWFGWFKVALGVPAVVLLIEAAFRLYEPTGALAFLSAIWPWARLSALGYPALYTLTMILSIPWFRHRLSKTRERVATIEKRALSSIMVKRYGEVADRLSRFEVERAEYAQGARAQALLVVLLLALAATLYLLAPWLAEALSVAELGLGFSDPAVVFTVVALLLGVGAVAAALKGITYVTSLVQVSFDIRHHDALRAEVASIRHEIAGQGTSGALTEASELNSQGGDLSLAGEEQAS